MDNHVIKLTGQAEIEQPLDRDRNYLVAGEWEEVSRTESPNQDGSLTTVYKLAPLRLLKLEDSGEKVRLKTKNKNSIRIRAAVFKTQGTRKYADMDHDEYYDMFADKLIANLEGVLELLDL